MIYAYKCRTCGLQVDSTTGPADTIGPCTNDFPIKCTGELRRLFIIRTEAVMQEHWNGTTNSPIRSNKQFDEEMKRQSEWASERTGMEHRFERVDPTDKAALGVTDQGIAESNAIRAKQGLPTFKV